MNLEDSPQDERPAGGGKIQRYRQMMALPHPHQQQQLRLSPPELLTSNLPTMFPSSNSPPFSARFPCTDPADASALATMALTTTTAASRTSGVDGSGENPLVDAAAANASTHLLAATTSSSFVDPYGEGRAGGALSDVFRPFRVVDAPPSTSASSSLSRSRSRSPSGVDHSLNPDAAATYGDALSSTDDSYKRKREKNNEAVRKSREKTKSRAMETAHKVENLKQVIYNCTCNVHVITVLM